MYVRTRLLCTVIRPEESATNKGNVSYLFKYYPYHRLRLVIMYLFNYIKLIIMFPRKIIVILPVKHLFIFVVCCASVLRDKLFSRLKISNSKYNCSVKFFS